MDHITDADLIRHLDGEPHGPVTPEAQPRLDLLRRRAERFSSLVAELGPSDVQTRASAAAIRPFMTRPVKRTPVAFKIAAAIALLLGLTWAAPPARAWMIERVLTVVELLGFTSSSPAPAPVLQAPPASDAHEIAAIRISFAITADTFDIAAAPAAGQLIVRRNRAALATAEAMQAPGASLTVLRGLRIEGPASPQATYTITLPNRVLAVRVRGRVYPLIIGDELRLDLARAAR